MNEVHQHYLVTSSHIDSIDHLIKNCRMKYRCWKYSHPSMIRAIYLEVFVDYEIYIWMAEEEINQTWKDNHISDFWTFRDMLSNNITNHKYSVDSNIRLATQQNQYSEDKSKYDARGEIGRPLVAKV